MSEPEPVPATLGWPVLTERLSSLVRGMGPAAWQRLDVVMAVALWVGLTLPVLLGYPSRDDAPAAVVAFGAGATLPLVVRRRWPVAVLVTVMACVVAAAGLGIRFTPFGSDASPVVGLAMYTVAERFDRRLSLRALALVVVATFVAGWIATVAHTEDENAVHTVAAVVGWLVGDAVRARRTYRAELAARQRREADERTRRAVAEERLQISRELHDVVSHNLSVIAVRAGVGRMVFETRPEEARAALVEVESVSRGALAELRLLVGTVRDPAPLVPARRLDDLPDLVEQVAVSGVEVTLEMRTLPVALSPTLELSAYRIVQEALTNVVKHAGPTRARVVVDHRDGVLSVEVSDDGPAEQTDPAGHGEQAGQLAGEGWGIAGMRERVAVFDGTLEAGPQADGGFRVLARLPVGSVTPGGSVR